MRFADNKKNMMNINKSFHTIVAWIFICNFITVLAQTTCNNGLGRVLYERLPNQQLQGFDDDIFRDTAPPFRVLEKCQDLCLRDRTSTNNLVRVCTSFDFQPGSRIASFSGSAEYEESTCYLTREQAAPEGIGNLMLVPNSVHFVEICLTSSRPERECPSRRYVFERHPRKKLKLPISDIKEITAANRSDCEDKCLNEFSFVCRSANYDSNLRTCSLSRFTRRTHPELLEDDANSDYLENTCLNAERRCDGLAVFVKEENKRLGGPFEVDIFNNMTLEECQTMCLRAEKYFCRSVEFDDQTKQCILSEEDSISQKDDISISSSPTHHFYDLVCLDNQRGTEYPDNSVTSHLFSSGRRPDTAFQRYRNSRLGGEFHSEITGRSLSECLDECLRQTSFQCRSAVYSDRFRTCRLSRYNQRDGMRIIYDADYDYYENLMLNVVGSSDEGQSQRPDTAGADRDRYPGKYPSTDGKYPYDKNPMTPDYDRYPADKYPADRYPAGDQYPNDRFPSGGDRDRYPGGDRYPSGGDRYPSGGDRYPPSDDRYPPGGERYPPGDDRYPGGDRLPGSNRFPGDDRYGDRYPGMDRDRYPGMDRDRFPGMDRDRFAPGMDRDKYPGMDRDRYPGMDRDEYPGMDRDRYPGMDRDRYPGMDRDRYPVGDRDRYPGRDKDRYPGMDRDKFPPDDGYPPEEFYPGDKNRYPGNDRDRYPMMGGRYPDRDMKDRFPPERYPPISDNRYPEDRYSMHRQYSSSGRDYYSAFGLSNRYSPSSRYPDDDLPGRYPPGRMPPRYPPPPITGPGNRFPPDRYGPAAFPPAPGSPVDRPRYPPEPDRFAPAVPGRYPPAPVAPIDIPGSRRPIVDPSRYPDPVKPYPPPPPTTDGKFPPVSPNRFPVGNDRFPVDIYKYGNRERFPSGSGYDRFPPPPPYYDLEYDDRFSDRYAPRPGYSGYGSSYDREYDGGYARRPPPGYPQYESPYRPPIQTGYDNTINAISGDGFGGLGPIRPHSTRCDDMENFKQMASRRKMRRQFVRKSLTVTNLIQCQRECLDARDFFCRSFNYRESVGAYDDRDVPNCELSDRDSRELDVQNPNMFDSAPFDYYERGLARSGYDGECLDVSQVCNEDGMEFTLRTPEGFAGRIYTYGFYDRCFFRGNGGTVNVLKISGPQGYPECGTQKYGDTLTNIVVVQFSDHVQTSRDKRFNLTCVFRGPGEAVVTSGYIGAGSGSPIPIEYLPAENTLSSKVRLMILYQGRPTTTIAVGDPLTFRLEAQDGYNQLTDIFATNVVARDPYSGRSIQLIDRFGCPVDPYVFPELDKLREGDILEARFNAFKIPESNFLVFEATVRTCREGCQPAYCPGAAGRSEPSFGRRRRSLNDTENEIANEENVMEINGTLSDNADTNKTDSENEIVSEEPEHVREMIEVFESRDEIEQESFARKLVAPVETVCMTPAEYHGLITAVILLMILLFSITLVSGLAYRRYWKTMSKNRIADRASPVNSFVPSTIRTHEPFSEPSQNNAPRRPPVLKTNGLSFFGNGLQKTFATGNLSRMCQMPVVNPIRNNTNNFDDPSEPIYTDPSLFERSRSLRSLSDEGRNEV